MKIIYAIEQIIFFSKTHLTGFGLGLVPIYILLWHS